MCLPPYTLPVHIALAPPYTFPDTPSSSIQNSYALHACSLTAVVTLRTSFSPRGPPSLPIRPPYKEQDVLEGSSAVLTAAPGRPATLREMLTAAPWRPATLTAALWRPATLTAAWSQQYWPHCIPLLIPYLINRLYYTTKRLLFMLTLYLKNICSKVAWLHGCHVLTL